MRFLTSNFQSRREERGGGTLIEVLVSLVIVTLVISSMLDVAVHRRRTAVQALQSRDALNLAIAWQSAHLANASWTKGDVGYFPDPVEARWTVEPIADAHTSGSGFAPDAQWRTLRVMRSNDDPAVLFLFRMDGPPSPGDSPSSPPDASEGNP